MSTYLLLRDNKQSGPYSTEELLAKGLKAYDLVWLEGKSAAWRYPSELPELKPFAPTVEEQPYDRFYKKPVAEQDAAEPAAAPVKEKETARTAAATGNAASSGKVYVTMPVAAGNVAAMRRQSVAVAMPAGAQKTSAEPVVPKDTPRKTIAEQPVPMAAAITVQPAIQNTPVASMYEYAARPVNAIARPAAGKNRMLLNIIAAVCLLLGGVVIGLAISNNQHKEYKSNLEKMAQVIAGHDSRNKQVSTAPVQPAEAPEESHTEIPAENKITPTTDLKTERTVKNKTGKTPVYTEALPVTETATTSTQTTPKEDAAPTATTETEKNVSPLDESAAAVVRHQLHKQVSVAAGTYKTGILGGISNLHLTVTNGSHYPLDEVAVEVKYLGPEKRVVKTQTVLFNDIAAGEQKTQEAPRSNRGVSIDYAIITIYSRALGLAKGF